MDLISGTPFWTLNNGLLNVYPTLKRNLACDVAIIGGGITGAMCAYYLTQAGYRVALLEKREMGWGSTSASTALLLYEIDVNLGELSEMIGEDDAAQAYRLCLDAIGGMESLVGELDDDCDFKRRPSLYCASRSRDMSRLEEEAAMRRKHGIPCRFLAEDEIAARYSFSYPAAIYSPDAAEVDAYRLSQALLQKSLERGLLAFDRTEVTKIETEGGVRLTTQTGVTVSAGKLVFATGYESQGYLKQRVANIINTFAFATEPIENFDGWDERCLIWETARPYLYLRTTGDNRAIVGGEDIPFKNTAAREALLERQTGNMKRRFDKMFPRIDTEVAFRWAGTFCDTRDGLAYIGDSPEWPNAYFALGFGGNGITYSWLAARIIRDFVCGAPNRDARLFGFERKS